MRTSAVARRRSLVAFALSMWCAIALAFATGSSACSSAEGPVTPPPDATVPRDAPRGDSKKADTSDAAMDRDGGRVTAPVLVSLAISAAPGEASSPEGGLSAVLTPPFSSSVHDYYVRCASGENSFVLSMKASPGAASVALQPVLSPSLPQQTVSVTAYENAAIVAAATSGSATTEYWIRCLPHDFPVLAFDLHPEAGSPTPGYYLVGNYRVLPGESGYAMVLDSRGVPVWYYRQQDGYGVFDVGVDPSGAIYFIPAVSPYPYERHVLDPIAVDYEIDSDEHEFQVLPNGHQLLIGSPLVTGVDLTGVKIGLADGGVIAMGSGSSIRTCDLAEVDSAGKIVWSWTGLEHLDPVKDTVYPAWSGQTYDGGLVIDVFHCNSIDVDPATGNLLVGSRDMDAVFYIDKLTGKILWKMGGSPVTNDKATYVPVSDAFRRQHDARLLSWTPKCGGGSGQVSLFDDQTLVPDAVARGIVYDVTVQPPDGAPPDCAIDAKSGATVQWQYTGTVSSLIMGSFRILTDGSRIVGWGLRGSEPLTFTEIDLDGDDMLDFTLDPDAGNASYRAIKVPMKAFDINSLRQTAGLAVGNPMAAGGAGGFGGDF